LGGAYTEFFSPFAYARQGMKGLPGCHPAGPGGHRAGSQAGPEGRRGGHRAGPEGRRGGHRADRGRPAQTEKATHEAELRAAVYSALGTTDYDALTVEEVSRRIDGLPGRAAREGSGVREEQQEPRDPRRADRPQDKGQLLRRAL
jgi:hypothetical protein